MPVTTPTIKMALNGVPVYVKREDQYEPPIPLTYTDPVEFPPPPFAKTRGLLPHLQALRERGVETVAYMDTSISMASWGVSYCAPLADLRVERQAEGEGDRQESREPQDEHGITLKHMRNGAPN